VSILHNPQNDRLCVISITWNRFCSRSSACSPLSCLQFCQMFTYLKSFLSPADSTINLKNMAIENVTILEMFSYTTLWVIVNQNISLRMSLVFGHWCFTRYSVATRIRCVWIFSNRFIANLPKKISLWKNFENRLRFGVVTPMTLVSLFIGHGVVIFKDNFSGLHGLVRLKRNVYDRFTYLEDKMTEYMLNW